MKRIAALAASNILVLVHPSRVLLLVLSSCTFLVHAQSVPPRKPGVLANTYTADPLTVKDKFDYRLYRGFLTRGIIGSAVSAAIAQAADVPEEWEGGASGYGKRYAASIGVSASRQAITFAMETAFHQDPRYFPTTQTGFKARFGNVIKQVFIAKNDRGEAVPAYGKLIGAFGAGQLANAWQPASNNSVGDGLIRSAFIIGGDAGINLLTEFVPAFRKRIYKSSAMHP